jgi:transposase
MTPPAYQLFVGVDIAAKTFTATWTQDGRTARPRPQTFEQAAAGYAAFIQQLATTSVAPDQALIVLEASGSYWVALAVALHQAGYAVSVINPAHAANFVRSLPRRSKTDALDADMLCQFALERQPPVWTPPPTVYHELQQRLVARDGVMEMRQQARNQLHAVQQWPVQVTSVVDQYAAIIADLDARIQTLEDEIATNVQDGAWAASATLLATIPGLGLLTIAWLLVATLNFEACATPEAAAAYAGLAPLEHQSGTSVRGRPTIGPGGHGRLRKALYLATLSAARHNPPVKAFYNRLRAAGKPVKVARCAAARKLLHIAWAVVHTQRPFDPTLGQPKQLLAHTEAVHTPT